ncbi:MAG: YfhO family protein [Anaerolineae bacterium]|nr:YfhO family protein [Anaerolineae bacterium]
MLPERSDPSRSWQIARWVSVFILVATAAILIPPGRLPYPPGSDVSDAALAHWPNAYRLQQSVRQFGEWPLWNSARMLGQSFAANPLSKVWYPPQWLALILPVTLHLDLMIYLHMVWLALGIIAWGRAEKLRPVAALFAALAWGLNAKLLSHLGAGHLDIVYALAWTPWLMAGVNRLVDERRGWSAVRLAAITAMLALADLRIAFYMLPMASVYGLLLLIRSGVKIGRIAGPVALAAGLFALLIAVEVVPVIGLGSSLTRDWITAQDAAVYSLPPSYLIGMLISDLGGFHEWMTYLAAPVVLLAILSLRRSPRWVESMVWWGVAIVAAVWSLGSNGPLFMPVANMLPLVGWFRVPSRAWFVVILALTVISAYGFDDLLRSGINKAWRMAFFAITATGLTWFAAALILLPDVPAASIAGASVGVSALALLLIGSQQLKIAEGVDWLTPRAAGSVLLVGAVVVVGWLIGESLVDGRTVEQAEAVDRAIIARLGDVDGRVYSPSFDLVGASAAQAGIETLHGVDPFQFQWSAEAIAEAAGVEMAGYSVVAPPVASGGEVDPALALADAVPDVGRLAVLGVSDVVARFPIEADGLALIAHSGGEYYYSVDLAAFDLPPFYDAEWIETPNRLSTTVSADQPTTLIVPVAWAPGWRAAINGGAVPVRRVSGALIGLCLPAGESDIELVYRPTADLLGAAISGITALALLIIWIVRTVGKANHGERE